MTTSVSNKGFNPVQWSYYLIQRGFNLVQRYKRVAAIKVSQLVIVKGNTIFPVALVSPIKMAIRWVDTKQYAITERVQTLLTLGFPMVWIPCPAGASIAIAPDQSLSTVGTESLLPLPSLLYCALPKSSHGCTSKATRATRGRRATVCTRGHWEKTWEGDTIVWSELLNGRQLAIYIIPRWMGKPKHYQVVYEPRATSKSGRSTVVATTLTLTEAKRKGKAFIKKLRRSK